MAFLSPRPPTPQGYRWLDVAGSNGKAWNLFRGEDKIGHYDATKEVYCRVNTDGTLSQPAPRPWRTNPGAVPAPPLTGTVTAKTPQREPIPVNPISVAEPAEAAETTETEAAPSFASKLGLPRWALYATGGGLAALALMFGLMSQVWRR